MLSRENFCFYNKDCIEVMQDMINKNIKVDLILTDPPYLYDLTGGGKGKYSQSVNKLRDSISFMSNNFDYEKIFSMFLQLQNIPNILIFCSNRQISQTMSFFEAKNLSVTLLVWYKYNAIPLNNNKYRSDIEYLVYIKGNGAYMNNNVPSNYKSKVFTESITSHKTHPAQKPNKILERLLMVHSKENDLIFDAFGGSFSTALACIKMDRKFIGCEIDKEIFDKSIENFNYAYSEALSDEAVNLFSEANMAKI